MHHDENSVGLHGGVPDSALMFTVKHSCQLCRSLNNALFSWLQFKALTDSLDFRLISYFIITQTYLILLRFQWQWSIP